MAFVANTAAPIPIKPSAYSVTLPSTAKTVYTDGSNAATLVAGVTDHPITLGMIYLQPKNTFTSARIMLFRYDGTTYWEIDEIGITGVSISTTTPFVSIPFSKWTPATPLVLPEGNSLLVASSVAQAASSIDAHAQLGKYF